MSRILCVAVLMSALATPAFAGMSEGVAAVTVGDYPRAIQEFEPLAAAGDPAAQYQLSKIYLEGHGPTNDVPMGVDLMTKAANGNYPEAQAQLGLMYAMGLGVPVDNAKAYGWLNKAVVALPDGTRRTVAESNRDAVLKRMTDAERTAAAVPTEPAAPADSTATQTASAPESTEPAATEPTATTATSAATKATAPAPTVTETATAPEPAPKPAEPAKVPEVVKTPEPVKAPEATKVAETTKAADTAKVETTKVAETTKTPEPTKTETAKAPDATMPAPPPADAEPTQVASAEAPDTSAKDAPAVKAMGSASAQEVQSSVRIQLASMPTEDLAWDQWKKISKKYAEQVDGLTAIVQPADLGTKGTFYRVQTGPFADKAAAEERCTAMKTAGLDCLVIRN